MWSSFDVTGSVCCQKCCQCFGGVLSVKNSSRQETTILEMLPADQIHLKPTILTNVWNTQLHLMTSDLLRCLECHCAWTCCYGNHQVEFVSYFSAAAVGLICLEFEEVVWCGFHHKSNALRMYSDERCTANIYYTVQELYSVSLYRNHPQQFELIIIIMCCWL